MVAPHQNMDIYTLSILRYTLLSVLRYTLGILRYTNLKEVARRFSEPFLDP